MAFSDEYLQKKVLKLIAKDVTEVEVVSYDHLNFYTVLEVPRTASPQEIFAAWCEKINNYSTSPRWTSLPAECPERLSHEKTLKMIARVLCHAERRCFYDIRLIVKEGIVLDWSKVQLTAQQGEYLRRIIYQDLTRLQMRMCKAHLEVIEALSKFEAHHHTLNRFGW